MQKKNHNGNRIYEAPAYYKQKKVSGRAVAFERMAPKVERNELCPCGSGLKFKRCHKTEDALLQAAFEQRQAEMKAQGKSVENPSK